MMSLDTAQFTQPLREVQSQFGAMKTSLTSGDAPVQLQVMNQAFKDSANNIAKLPDLAKETGTSINDVTSKGRGLISVMMGLEAASTGSLRGVLTGMRGLGATLGQVGLAIGAVGGAFAVGWNIGSRIEELTGIGGKLWSAFYPVEKQLGSIRDRAREATSEIIKMGNQRMEVLKESMSAIRDLYAQSQGSSKASFGRSRNLTNAQEDAELAQARANKSGTDLIREEADIKAKYAQKQREIDSAEAKKTIDNVNKAQTDAAMKRMEMESKFQAANEKLRQARDNVSAATKAPLGPLREEMDPGVPEAEHKAAILAAIEKKKEADLLVQAAEKNYADAINEEEKTVERGTQDRKNANNRLTVLEYNEQAAMSDHQAQMKKADEADAAAKAKEQGPKVEAVTAQRTNVDIASDRFSKIGLYVGGGATDLARKTANATEKMAKTLDKYLPKLVPQGGTTATWGA
jgi:hypothetical protein